MRKKFHIFMKKGLTSTLYRAKLIKIFPKGHKSNRMKTLNSVFAYFYYCFIYYVDKACFAVQKTVA